MAVIIAQKRGDNFTTLQFLDLHAACCIGSNGLTVDKIEGDNCTPIGTWPLRRVFYRADKQDTPLTQLPLTKITKQMGWCDDPKDQDNYNKLVALPHPYSHEKLWRNDDLYDIVVELGYNDRPPIAGRGSAIFMHVMDKDGIPTAGCISLRKDHLLNLISLVELNEVLKIKASK